MWLRWCSTVFGLRKSDAATSRFVMPWATSSAIFSSDGVSSSAPAALLGARAGRAAGRGHLGLARAPTHGFAPRRSKISSAAVRCGRASARWRTRRRRSA